jgi:hypothetical protein
VGHSDQFRVRSEHPENRKLLILLTYRLSEAQNSGPIGSIGWRNYRGRKLRCSTAAGLSVIYGHGHARRGDGAVQPTAPQPPAVAKADVGTDEAPAAVMAAVRVEAVLYRIVEGAGNLAHIAHDSMNSTAGST